MPAGPIGASWAAGSWEDTAWEENTWAELGTGSAHSQNPRASRYVSSYVLGAIYGVLLCVVWVSLRIRA